MENLTPEELERYGGAEYGAGAEAGAADDAQYDAVPWPDPMNEAALHGITGDFVRMVDPTTEADPVAVLLSFLAAFGAVVAFLGIRYLLSVRKLKGDVYKTTSQFSWSNFKKH